MERRTLLKSLSATAGLLVAMPIWAKNWNSTSITNQTSLISTEMDLILADIVETIIPEGKIPGAKSLGVPAFIEKMIKDCYAKEAQDDFKNGFELLNGLSQLTYSLPFKSLDSSQKETVLKTMGTSTNSKQKDFYTTVKNLTIQGYTTSEYVLVNHLKYEMAPGHYYGCVNV
jgi:Gluconate 2-dehydrogenase subunit 3